MNEPISLIVCVHNEQFSLPSLLESIQPGKQDEIVLVLDRCTDSSELIVDRFASHLPIRKVTVSTNEWPNSPKKWALFQGISNALNEHLVFTDADCLLPASFFEECRSAFNYSDIIIGYSLPVIGEKPAFIYELQWMDALFTAARYTLFFEMNKPYMAVGRNWAFKKSFFKRELLESHSGVMSGDDDLLFQKMLINKPTVNIVNLNVPTTGTKSTWKAVITQKARHYQAGIEYPFGILILLAFYDLWIPLSTGLLVISGFFNWTPGMVSGFLFTCAGILLITSKSRQLLKKLDLSVSSITRISFFALLYHFLLPFFSVFLQVLKPKWKS